MEHAGLFITFEGVDGAGKSTQARRLAEYWRNQGRETVLTREPGGTSLGCTLRKMVLDPAEGEGSIAPRAEALLFAADRAQHAARVIMPALQRGAVVISDRYFDSSVAYQAGGRELDGDEIRELSLWATNGLVPHRTYLLDIDPSVSHQRLSGPEDRMEAAGDGFQQRTREAFLAMARREPARFMVLDATRPKDEVAAQIERDSVMLATMATPRSESVEQVAARRERNGSGERS